MNPAFHSPIYPYERVQTGFLTFRGAEEIPHKLLTYLMDLPLPDGYEPVDDNTRPRVRLMKYLWHDGAKPLGERLPSAKEKQSLLFDGNEPVVDSSTQRRKHPKGTDFATIPASTLKKTEEWINNYPRKIFNFHTAAEVFEACMNSL